MASGSSGRPSSGSKGFDFGADDVLCSYEDSLNQESSNGKRVDSSMPGNSGKDFSDGRTRRTLVDMYTPQEESGYQDVISTVEKTMKKYADTLLRFLEGMSGRLSQLELYCYNLERSIGELRSDLVRDHDESDQKLRSLEKHLQEVHRSVQILRDKQELADTQKELAKLLLRQKESTSTHNSHREEDNVAPSASEPKKHDTASDSQNQQLALALPRHPAIPAIPAQPQSYNELPVHQPPPSLPVQQPMAVQTQPNTYYPLQNQMPNQPHVNPHSQPELQYVNQSPQMLEPPRQAAPKPQSSVNPTLPHPYPAYQQQWPQQIPPLQPTPQAPVRSQTPPVYPPYPNQVSNPTETFPNSMPMQGPFSPVSQPGISEPVGYGYGGPGRAQQPHHNIVRQPSVQPQGTQTSFGAHLSEGGYAGVGSHPPPSNMRGGYMMYETEGNRASHPSHYAQGGYPQQPPPAGMVGGSRHSGPQVMRNHPFSELMDKAVSMGYARDQVASALRRMEENGQPIDFNTLLDMLNGAPQRAW